MRSLIRAPRVRLIPTITSQPHRFAHQSYGNVQSGHEQGIDEKNPKQHLEHPGPKTPAEQGEGSSQGSSQAQSQSQPDAQSASTSSGNKPKIQTPKSAAEDSDPEVKKHNEEMAQRHDKSANQLSEKDNKVDKNFWKGDVGDIKSDGSK